MNNFHMSQTGRSPASRQGFVTAFLRWWGGELRAMTPDRLAVMLGISEEIVLLVPAGDDFTVQRLAGKAPQNLGSVTQPGVAARVARLRAAGALCVLRIPSDRGLRRRALIAVSALARGFDAVAGEIERQTPFAPDQVYAGYRAEEAADAHGRVLAHLALVPIASVDAVLQTLAGCGIIPDRISLADDADAHAPGDTVHIIASRRMDPAPKFLFTVAGVLLTFALASPHWRNAVALSRLEPELNLARQEALAASQTHNGLGDAQAQINWLAAMRAQRPPVTDLLNAISAAIPDTAYLAQFELSGRLLALQGVAGSASALVAPLEALPMVAKVEFSAPTLRDPLSGLEQFQITLTLQGAAQPEPGE